MIAYCNGEFLDFERISISPLDRGFIHGAVVAERLRTFGQRAFQLEQHWKRFSRGLELCQIEIAEDLDSIDRMLLELINRNRDPIGEQSELSICFFATPGKVESTSAKNLGQGTSSIGSQFVAYLQPLNPKQWSQYYHEGVALVASNYRDVPSDCWPKNVKIRSRMHYFLAELECPANAFPILLDLQGKISDSSIANIIAVDSKGTAIFVKDTFAGVSGSYVRGLCMKLGIPCVEKSIDLEELSQSAEVMLASTNWCLLPVNRVDHRILQLDTDNKNSVFRRLIHEWSTAVEQPIAPEWD